MAKPAEVLTDIYDAWRTEDLDWFATYLPDDFSHFINIPVAMHPLGGLRQGKHAVLERLSQIFQQFHTKRLETGPVALHANEVAIEVRTRCQHLESGAWLETTKSNLWTLEAGWPVRLYEYYDIDRFRAFMNSTSRR